MRTRFFRILVCLVLICALLVQVSPLQAKAVGISASAVSVAASLLLGLGIGIGVDAIQHSELANNAVTALQAAGVVVSNGLMDIVSLGSGLFGVKSDVIQNLFNWLHTDSGAVVDPTQGLMSDALRTNMQARIDYEISVLGSPVYFLATGVKGQTYLDSLYASKYPFVKVNDTIVCYNENGQKADIYRNSFQSWGSFIKRDVYQTLYWSENIILIYGDELGFDYTVKGDLTANFIANPGLSLAEGYPVWAANSVTIPNAETGENEVYYPIALGNSMEETQSFTQEQVWAGEGTYVDTETGTGSGSVTVPETVTLSDILAGVLSIPNAIATGIEKVVAAVVALPAAITDFFTITSDDLILPVTLTDFFPFCIPGDIRDLVTVLDAEPEAPSFEFDLQLPFQAEPYQIAIDLSVFDPLAQLLRRLELMVFIIGLAMATRNYYIRG